MTGDPQLTIFAFAGLIIMALLFFTVAFGSPWHHLKRVIALRGLNESQHRLINELADEYLHYRIVSSAYFVRYDRFEEQWQFGNGDPSLGQVPCDCRPGLQNCQKCLLLEADCRRKALKAKIGELSETCLAAGISKWRVGLFS